MACPHVRALKKTFKITAIVLAVLFFVNGLAAGLVLRLVFARYDGQPDNRLPLLLPEDCHLETVSFPCRGEILAGYYCDAPDTENLVVLVPGIHAIADHYAEIATALLTSGYDVFLFDPTGTGQSSGNWCLGYSRCIADTDAALTYIEGHLSHTSLFLLGHSRGATAVCAMPGLAHSVDGIIAINGFDSAMEAIIGMAKPYAGPLATLTAPALYLWQRLSAPQDELRFSVSTAMQYGNTPTLVLQGEADQIIRPENNGIAHALLEHPAACCQVVTIPNAGHTDLLYGPDKTPNETTMAMLLAWMGRLVHD